jgi:hypothetical protein
MLMTGASRAARLFDMRYDTGAAAGLKVAAS